MSRLLALLGGLLSLTVGWSASLPPAEVASSLVVARYADQEITLRAFERAYAHDVGGWPVARSNSQTDYTQFLSTYLDYRLKVYAAQTAGYRTAPDIQAQQRAYRRQMIRHRLRTDSVLTPIMHALPDTLTATTSHKRLRQRVEQRPATHAAERAFWRRTRARYNAHIDTLRLMEQLGIDRLTVPAAPLLRAHAASTATVGATADSAFTLSTLHAFWAAVPRMRHHALDQVLDAFAHAVTLDRAARHYAATDVSFRRQLQRHHDGLLLFALMQDSVWTPALGDTHAQRAFFEQHRARYIPAQETPTNRAESVAPSDSQLDAAASVSFADVKRAVVRDFQAYRERQFVRRLRNRYHAQLYPEHLRAAFRHDSSVP